MYEGVLEIWLAGEDASVLSDQVAWDRGRTAAGLLDLLAEGERVVMAADEADDPASTPPFAGLPEPWAHDYALCGPPHAHPQFDDGDGVLPVTDWEPERVVRVSISHNSADVTATWPASRRDVQLPVDLRASLEGWIERLRDWSRVPLSSHEAPATASAREVVDAAAASGVHLRDGRGRRTPTIIERDPASPVDGVWSAPDVGERTVIVLRPRAARRRMLRSDIPMQEPQARAAAQLVEAISPHMRAWRVDPDRTRAIRTREPFEEVLLEDERMRGELPGDTPTEALFDAQIDTRVVRLGITLPFDEEYDPVLSDVDVGRVTRLVEGIRSFGYGDMVEVSSYGAEPFELDDVPALLRLLGRG